MELINARLYDHYKFSNNLIFHFIYNTLSFILYLQIYLLLIIHPFVFIINNVNNFVYYNRVIIVKFSFIFEFFFINKFNVVK